MVIAIIVISVVLALALVAQFTVVGLKRRQERLAQGLERQTFKEWWGNHKPSKRRLIQVYAALLYNANIKGFISGQIYTGDSKYMCVPGLNCYSCPGAVGACPLGALQNALRETNRSVPYYMLGMIGIFGLTLARTICGFLCPIGLGQELLYKIRTPKLKKNKATRVLSYFKYVLLAVFVIAIPIIYGLKDLTLPGFCKYICPAGTLGGAIALLINPANDALFATLGPAFTWKFCVLGALCVASVFIYRFFCRFICPLGAIYGFFNRIALMGVKLDSGKCTDCGLCVQHCKMDIRKVGDHECINCGECISVCPAKAISWKGSQIFLRGISTEQAPQEEVKPLTQFIKQPEVAVEAAQEVEAVATQAEQKPARKKRDRNFWLQVAAWAVALAVLVTALICYNVDFKKPEVPPEPSDVTVGNAIGDTCPDFTLELYQGGGTYNLYENRGKITILNFWYIGCGPCEHEMPSIGQLSLSEEYDIEIVAIHGLYTKASKVDSFLIENGWDKYNIKFAQDRYEDRKYVTYASLGGNGPWPLTVILDEEGIVRYNSYKAFDGVEEIKAIIDGIKNSD